MHGIGVANALALGGAGPTVLAGTWRAGRSRTEALGRVSLPYLCRDVGRVVERENGPPDIEKAVYLGASGQI